MMGLLLLGLRLSDLEGGGGGGGGSDQKQSFSLRAQTGGVEVQTVHFAQMSISTCRYIHPENYLSRAGSS